MPVPVVKVQPATLRKLNERRVLNCLRVNKTLSRADIQRELNTTMPTVSRIVDTLIAQGWVRETGYGDSAMGRPPVMLEINPTSPVAVGIEVGRETVRLVMVNLVAEVLHRSHWPLAAIDSAESLVTALGEFIKGCDVPLDQVLGVGIGAPGARDPHPELPKRLMDDETHHHWQRDRVEQLVMERLRLPAWIDNDANAAVLGELWFGSQRQQRNIVFVYADAGVGAGVAVDGTVYSGENNSAGEFAHTIVDLSSEEICECGRRGCLGSVAHTTAIRAAVSRMRPDEPVDLGVVVQRAKAGIDPEAAIISRALDFLAVGVINLIQVLDPGVVVLGGTTFLVDSFLVDEMILRLNGLMQPRHVAVIAPAFGHEAVAVGAATLVLRTVYDHTQVIDASP